MKKLLLLAALFGTLIIAGQHQQAGATTEGDGGGGYIQLPTCGPAFFGVTLYVQGHLWRCIDANPDHWILV